VPGAGGGGSVSRDGGPATAELSTPVEVDEVPLQREKKKKTQARWKSSISKVQAAVRWKNLVKSESSKLQVEIEDPPIQARQGSRRDLGTSQQPQPALGTSPMGPDTQVVVVTIPDGVAAGDQIAVEIPHQASGQDTSRTRSRNKHRMVVTLPPGSQPGMQLRLMVKH